MGRASALKDNHIHDISGTLDRSKDRLIDRSNDRLIDRSNE